IPTKRQVDVERPLTGQVGRLLTRKNSLDRAQAEPAHPEQLSQLLAAAPLANGQLVRAEFGMGKHKPASGHCLGEQAEPSLRRSRTRTAADLVWRDAAACLISGLRLCFPGAMLTSISSMT